MPGRILHGAHTPNAGLHYQKLHSVICRLYHNYYLYIDSAINACSPPSPPRVSSRSPPASALTGWLTNHLEIKGGQQWRHLLPRTQMPP